MRKEIPITNIEADRFIYGIQHNKNRVGGATGWRDDDDGGDDDDDDNYDDGTFEITPLLLT